jgi:hypothetical protein
MGQAKQRGTRDERVQQAKERQAEIDRQQVQGIRNPYRRRNAYPEVTTMRVSSSASMKTFDIPVGEDGLTVRVGMEVPEGAENSVFEEKVEFDTLAPKEEPSLLDKTLKVTVPPMHRKHIEASDETDALAMGVVKDEVTEEHVRLHNEAQKKFLAEQAQQGRKVGTIGHVGLNSGVRSATLIAALGAMLTQAMMPPTKREPPKSFEDFE